jgi:hypothetical protein
MKKFLKLAPAVLLISACNPQEFAEDTARRVAQQNGFILDDGKAPIPEGLPTEDIFEARYGSNNCNVESYSEFRDRYYKVGRALKTFFSSGKDEEPGSKAKLVRAVSTGPKKLSLSPEYRNVFYVNGLEGSQGFGNYIIEVEAKGFRCRIESYEETRVQ